MGFETGCADESQDLKPDALMKVRKRDGQYVSYTDGTPVLIVADSNAVGSANIGEDVSINGVIARAFNVTEQAVAIASMDDSEIQNIQSQMDAVYARVLQDIKEAGIEVDDRGSWQQRTAVREDRAIG